MESKKIVFNFGAEGMVEANADADLLEHIQIIYAKEAKINQKDIYKSFNFKKGTIWYAKNKSKNGITPESFKFIIAVAEAIHKQFGSRYQFNIDSNKFQLRNTNARKEFRDGTYYGYFKTSNKKEENTTHFILLVKGKQVTISSQHNSSVGQFDEDNGLTYHALLKCPKNKINFFIGRKNFDYTEKIFSGTWNNKNDQMCCALCVAVFVEQTPYKTIEDIERHKAEDHKKIHNEILSKKPKHIDDFLNGQENKFIIQNSDFTF